VIKFQKMENDVFDPIHRRIKNVKGRMRKMGVKHFIYAAIDITFHYYFIILEKISEDLESIEEEILTDSFLETLMSIYKLKRHIIFLHKFV